MEEESGNVLYENYEATNQPLCKVFTFSNSDSNLTINIHFNTTSDVFQVEWHIKTITENNIRIRPGNNYGNDAFVTEAIQNSREGKSLSLIIKNVSLIELNRMHYLNINSGQLAKNSQQYGFFVVQEGNSIKMSIDIEVNLIRI